MNQGDCGICTGDPQRRAWINAELVKGTPHTHIEAESRTLGYNVKRETLRRHVNVCVANGVHNITVAKQGREKADHVDTKALTSLPEGDDFAVLIRAAAVEKLRKGELRISTGDGLAAQALIDKRMERQKDRDIFARVGMMLAGAMSTPPPIVIEGEFNEVLEDTQTTHMLTDGE